MKKYLFIFLVLICVLVVTQDALAQNKEVKNIPDNSSEENIDKTTDKIDKSSQENDIDNNDITKTKESYQENNMDNNTNNKNQNSSSENNARTGSFTTWLKSCLVIFFADNCT